MSVKTSRVDDLTQAELTTPYYRARLTIFQVNQDEANKLPEGSTSPDRDVIFNKEYDLADSEVIDEVLMAFSEDLVRGLNPIMTPGDTPPAEEPV